MRNPYQSALGYLTLAGLAALVIALLVYMFAQDASTVAAADRAVLAVGFMWTAGGWTLLALVAWLVVGAVTWRPTTSTPASSVEAGAPSEA
jgi:hypothetical protein